MAELDTNFPKVEGAELLPAAGCHQDHGISSCAGLCKAVCSVLLPVLGTLGCTTQAWAASKSQLPSSGTGDAEQSCCFLGGLGLLPPAPGAPGCRQCELGAHRHRDRRIISTKKVHNSQYWHQPKVLLLLCPR